MDKSRHLEKAILDLVAKSDITVCEAAATLERARMKITGRAMCRVKVSEIVNGDSLNQYDDSTDEGCSGLLDDD